MRSRYSRAGADTRGGSRRWSGPRADHDLGLEVVHLGDRALEQIGLEMLLAAVEIGDVGNRHRRGAALHDESVRRPGGRPGALLASPGGCEKFLAPSRIRTMTAVKGSHFWFLPRRRRHRALPTASSTSAPRFSTSTACRGSTSRHQFVLGRDGEGRVTERVHARLLPPKVQELYVEVTVMKQSLVTRKNRKLRQLRELYPGREESSSSTGATSTRLAARFGLQKAS